MLPDEFAHSGRLEYFGGEGWLAIGDAAMSFDPLSGLGMVKAMQSGIDAAGALVSRADRTASSYHRNNETLWTQFLKVRTQYYIMEKRWPRELFWARRASLRDATNREST